MWLSPLSARPTHAMSSTALIRASAGAHPEARHPNSETRRYPRRSASSSGSLPRTAVRGSFRRRPWSTRMERGRTCREVPSRGHGIRRRGRRDGTYARDVDPGGKTTASRPTTRHHSNTCRARRRAVLSDPNADSDLTASRTAVPEPVPSSDHPPPPQCFRTVNSRLVTGRRRGRVDPWLALGTVFSKRERRRGRR